MSSSASASVSSTSADSLTATTNSVTTVLQDPRTIDIQTTHSPTTSSATPSFPIQAVIWDLDGTIIDTETLSTQAINITLARYNKSCTPQLKREIVGTRRDWWTNHILQRTGLDGEMSPKQLGDEWEDNCSTLLPTCVLMPGIDTLTAALRKTIVTSTNNGTTLVKQGIATSSNRPLLKLANHPQILERIEFIATGDMVAHSKPAPDIFLLVAEKLQILPQYCIAVEDSPMGIEAAKRAGMFTIAVPDPAVGIEARVFFDAGADIVYDSLENVTVEEFLSCTEPDSSKQKRKVSGENNK